MTKSISLLYFLLFLTLTGTTCTPPTEPGKETGPDTTSQNFTFETFEFGDGLSSSYLNDVWIFDENNIWAVGWIQQNEFQGNCNIIKWNGKSWKYINSGNVSSSSGIESIWAVDSNLIYFGSGAIRRYKNGIFRYENTNFGTDITKIWGSSANNIWGVGQLAIVHFNGTAWTKVKDGSDNLQFFAIHGYQENIYARWSNNNSTEGGLYLLKNGTATEYFKDSTYLNWYGRNLFVLNEKIAISGTYPPLKIDLVNRKIQNLLPHSPKLVVYSSASNSVNDIFLWGTADTGSELVFVHYNGTRLYRKQFSNSFVGLPTKVKVKNDLIVLTGFKEDKGFVSIIRRK